MDHIAEKIMRRFSKLVRCSTPQETSSKAEAL